MVPTVSSRPLTRTSSRAAKRPGRDARTHAQPFSHGCIHAHREAAETGGSSSRRSWLSSALLCSHSPTTALTRPPSNPTPLTPSSEVTARPTLVIGRMSPKPMVASVVVVK